MKTLARVFEMRLALRDRHSGLNFRDGVAFWWRCFIKKNKYNISILLARAYNIKVITTICARGSAMTIQYTRSDVGEWKWARKMSKLKILQFYVGGFRIVVDSHYLHKRLYLTVGIEIVSCRSDYKSFKNKNNIIICFIAIDTYNMGIA